MHGNPTAPTTLQRDLMKLLFWKILLFEVVFFFMISPWLDLSLWLLLWKSSCLITLEIWSLVLNLILLSSKSRLTKPWFHTSEMSFHDCFLYMFFLVLDVPRDYDHLHSAILTHSYTWRSQSTHFIAYNSIHNQHTLCSQSACSLDMQLGCF